MYKLKLEMITSTYCIRVRYAETDKMDYVYYGNYATYLEIGPTELLRGIGMSYNELEKRGILLPVADLKITYKNAAKYDDVITVKTTLTKIPSAKIHFSYQLYCEDTLLCEAETTLVFVNQNTRKPIRCPQDLLEMIKSKIDSE